MKGNLLRLEYPRLTDRSGNCYLPYRIRRTRDEMESKKKKNDIHYNSVR